MILHESGIQHPSLGAACQSVGGCGAGPLQVPGEPQEDDGEVLGVTAVSLEEVLTLFSLRLLQRLHLAHNAYCKHLSPAISTA